MSSNLDRRSDDFTNGQRDVTALPLDNEREEDIGVFVERLRELAEDWRYSDELIGLVVRRRWPQRYDHA